MTEDFMVNTEHVHKIFGPSKEVSRALSLLQDGTPRDAIRERTGCLVAVSDVSVAVRAGELFVLMGLSGSGKSTFLRCLNGIVNPTAGHIAIAGTHLNPQDRQALIRLRRQHMTMVFQHFGLLPHRTVRSNVGFGLEVQGRSTLDRQRFVNQALEQVGLSQWADALPRELSGGMQQRVGIARALATGAPILLMDEPFSALDPLIRREMQDELLRLQRELGRTIIFVTHDLNEAMKLGDRVAIMRDGALVQIGTPENILSHPADEYVAQFIEDIDRSRALTAASIMRESNPLLGSAGPHQALRHMRKDGLSSAFVVDRERHLLGYLTVDRAVAAIEKSLDTIRESVIPSPVAVLASDSVVDVAKQVAEHRMPAAVMDDDAHLIGLVTWVDIVSTVGGVAAESVAGGEP